MLTTYMNHQLTRLDVVTTEDGYLLTLNQVMEFKVQKIEHVEAFIKQHKFKPIIMGENRMEYSGTAGCQSRLFLQSHRAGGERRQSRRAHRQNAGTS